MANLNVRIPDTLMADLDERLVNSRYKNRSELIRDLVRRYCEGLLIPIKPNPAR